MLFERISCAENFMELNKFADEYAVWSDIIGEDNALMIEKYRSKLHDMLMNLMMNGNVDVLSYDYDLWHIDSKKIKDLYEEK